MPRILLFGRLKDLSSHASFEWDGAPGIADVAALKRWLAAREPELGVALTAPGVRVAIDQEIVSEEALLAGAAEIAFMPPMSGG